mmetsp:Transcript_35867/g.72841  ORF Transcript_35867/g.72841 Transcript_35867/m.72841 type:complete len:212 (-) Transcript_35867:354-989(-)
MLGIWSVGINLPLAAVGVVDIAILSILWGEIIVGSTLLSSSSSSTGSRRSRGGSSSSSSTILSLLALLVVRILSLLLLLPVILICPATTSRNVTTPTATTGVLPTLVVPLQMHAISSQHFNLVIATSGELINGGITGGIEHVKQTTTLVKTTGFGGIVRLGRCGEHPHVINSSVALEEAADLINGPIVGAIGNEELASFVEGGQRTRRDRR